MDRDTIRVLRKLNNWRPTFKQIEGYLRLLDIDKVARIIVVIAKESKNEEEFELWTKDMIRNSQNPLLSSVVRYLIYHNKVEVNKRRVKWMKRTGLTEKIMDELYGWCLEHEKERT